MLPTTPEVYPHALASSKSMCILNLKLFFTLTTTLSNIKGVGFITAQKIVESQDKCKLLWDYLLKEVNITPLVEVKNSNSTTFAVTGSVPETFKNRNEFVKYMEDKGYTFHSSIKKDTNILITDNPNSNSSKIVKARKLGLEIKSFENF